MLLVVSLRACTNYIPRICFQIKFSLITVNEAKHVSCCSKKLSCKHGIKPAIKVSFNLFQKVSQLSESFVRSFKAFSFKESTTELLISHENDLLQLPRGRPFRVTVHGKWCNHFWPVGRARSPIILANISSKTRIQMKLLCCTLSTCLFLLASSVHSLILINTCCCVWNICKYYDTLLFSSSLNKEIQDGTFLVLLILVEHFLSEKSLCWEISGVTSPLTQSNLCLKKYPWFGIFFDSICPFYPDLFPKG